MPDAFYEARTENVFGGPRRIAPARVRFRAPPLA